MFETLHNVLGPLWTIFEFLVFTVFVKMIFAKWVAEKIKKWLVTKNERNAAIWEHYYNGHPAESVLECAVGKCTVFHETAKTTVPARA